jgi:hypothetical protein
MPLVKIFAFLVLVLPVSASALTISPAKIELAVDPGQTAIGEIEVFNEQQETKTFYTSFENFEPRGETGAPYFVGGGSGLASWIESTESFEIEPGEEIKIPYSITVPKDATAGGYFAGIFFGTQPPSSNGESEVSIGGKIGSLVLLRVNGAITEEGGVLDFNIEEGKVLTGTPVVFSHRFNNNGGDRVVPKGQLTIKNMFFLNTATLPVNASDGSVLPGSVRKYETIWQDQELPENPSFFQVVKHQFSHFHLGVYQATLDISWGESSQTNVSKLWFFIFPWQLIVVSLVGLIALLQGIRFYNRLIISRASSNK